MSTHPDARAINGVCGMDGEAAAQWLTYAEAGERLGVSPEAVRARAIRKAWRRQLGNDGKARVFLSPDMCTPVEPAINGRPTPVRKAADPALMDALREHIETLRAEVEQLKGQLSQRDAQLVTEGERADRAIADWSALAQRLAVAETQLDASETRATFAEAKTEHVIDKLVALTQRLAIAEERARPWWRRLLGAA